MPVTKAAALPLFTLTNNRSLPPSPPLSIPPPHRFHPASLAHFLPDCLNSKRRICRRPSLRRSCLFFIWICLIKFISGRTFSCWFSHTRMIENIQSLHLDYGNFARFMAFGQARLALTHQIRDFLPLLAWRELVLSTRSKSKINI